MGGIYPYQKEGGNQMDNKRFKPKIGKMFYIIWIPTVLFLAVCTWLSFASPLGFAIILATDLFTLYFLITSLFGYVELREETFFVKFGLLTQMEIPYTSIRDVCKERRFYSDSMMSLKYTLEHVNIKYNRFDLVSVSVVENDELIHDLAERIGRNRKQKEEQES